MAHNLGTAIIGTNGSPVTLIKRPSEERGHADHGWLKTFHTFSFANYADRRFEHYGSLRVINEDRVAPKEGFGTHSHTEFEIFSYIVDGELEHRDSMGNVEILKRGDVQLTSAGTGIRHSEKTNGDKPVHFIQIWSVPSESNLPPKYFTRHYTDEEKKDVLVPIVAPVGGQEVTHTRQGTGPTPVHSPLWLYASLLSPGATVEHVLRKPAGSDTAKKAYFHLIQNSGYNPSKATGQKVKINGALDLAEGDGAFAAGAVGDKIEITNIGDGVAEILLFDLE